MRHATTWVSALVLVLLIAGWTGSAAATIDWNDGFEYANQTALEAVWVSSCPGVSTIIGPSTTRAFSGSRSLKEHFGGHDVWSCFIDRNLNGSGTTLYSRYYMYMDNFTVDSTSTKITLSGEACCYPSFWWVMMFGSPVLSVAVQGIILDSGVLDTVTVFGGAIPQNQWVCIETRLTMSSPGVDNGIVQAWINGTQVINKTTQRMRGATLNQGNSPSATFRFVRLYTQNGVGDIYYDDYAVSRDARIGCGSTPPPPPVDTTPPAVPTGLSVAWLVEHLESAWNAVTGWLLPSEAVAETGTLTWSPNAETDLAGYKVYQSLITGQYGAPVATLGKVATHTMTFPTLTVDQRYYFTVTAYDLGGRESLKSLEVNKLVMAVPVATKPGVPVLTVTSPSPSSLLMSWPSVDNGIGQPATVAIRLMPMPMNWGMATDMPCPASPCSINGLIPGTSYDVQAVAYRGTLNVDAVFSALSAVATMKTLPTPVDPPPATPKGLIISSATPDTVILTALKTDCTKVLTSTLGSTTTMNKRTVTCVK